jgi:hypothetical protein
MTPKGSPSKISTEESQELELASTEEAKDLEKRAIPAP